MSNDEKNTYMSKKSFENLQVNRNFKDIFHSSLFSELLNDKVGFIKFFLELNKSFDFK